MAAITKGLRGEELTEMAELAALGAVAFTDDGRPVASAGVMRNALAYSAVASRPLALHEEEPTLSGSGQMHEGTVSAELGLTGWPALAETVMIERDLALAAYEQRPCAYHARVGGCLGRRDPCRQGARCRGHGRGDAAPPLPHRRGRSLASTRTRR